MSRRENDLFIGADFLSLEGRTIKHPSLINEYGSININKVSDDPMKFVGMDLETDVNTGNMKLLGFYIEGTYINYTENFLSRLLQIVRWAERKKMNIAYWNRLDPFQLFKLFLLEVNEYEQRNAMRRFGKTGGRWDRNEGKWDEENPPVISIKLRGYEFGIQTVIRSSIKFFYKTPKSKTLRTIWAFDIAQLYQFGLEFEALGRFDEKTQSYPDARLPYYSKVDESAHIVDWDKYWDDKKYHDLVNYSNELDARAVHDLADLFQRDFYKAFNYYPVTLISAGSIARASIVATILNKYKAKLPNKKKGIGRSDAYLKAYRDIESIPLVNYYDDWLEKYGGDVVKNLMAITTEAYKGGYIEALQFGFVPEAWYADISSAYPAFIQKLYDLRNSKVSTGKGVPPSIPYSYCFIRGDVTIPEYVNVHPLTIKHPVSLDTNIRAVGTYRASYLKEERDYLIELGATFENEEWYNIETEGKPSPLSLVSSDLADLRTHFLSIGDSAQYIAKQSNNSLYGVLFEAVNSHYEVANSYSYSDIYNLIKSSLDVNSSREYDLKMKHADIELLVLDVLEMLENEIPQLEVAEFITEKIFNFAFFVNEVSDNRYVHLKGYVRSINLAPLRSEMVAYFGDDYLGHYNRFNNREGLYYDDVIMELESFGVFLDGDNEIDKLIHMFMLYDQLKTVHEVKRYTHLRNFLSIDAFTRLNEQIIQYILDMFDKIPTISIEAHGYRAGEFFNPLYASWITSQTRLLLSKASNNITDNGGEVILLMTDSIFWTGGEGLLSSKYYSDVKTTGLFERPSRVENLLSLGSGRYEYYENGRYFNKKRGLNTTDWHSADGLDRTEKFSWIEAITNPKYHTEDGKIKVNVRTLVSVGMVVNSRKRIEDGEIRGFDIYDLGKVIEQTREVDALIGITKRILPQNVDNVKLGSSTFKTKPLYFDKYMFGKVEIIDQTLPKLRKLMMEITPETSKERRRRISRKTSKTYFEKNKEEIYERYREKYGKLRGLGYTRDESRQMANWSYERLSEEGIM